MSDGKDADIYFIYKNGRKIKVTREEWEKSWLDWYMSKRDRD